MEQQLPPAPPKKRFSLMQVIGITFLACIVAVALTLLGLKYYFMPSPFTPVELSQAESIRLEKKLDLLENGATATASKPQANSTDSPDIKPEPYTETDANRTIHLTERELNSLLAKNTDLADKMAIDLADDMVSLKMLVPLDPDFPFLGGKTLRIKAGLELSYRNAQPVIIFRGISIMGVPLPKAWLGGLKGLDLIEEFGNEKGFWQDFAAGVEALQVNEGNLEVRLKE